MKKTRLFKIGVLLFSLVLISILSNNMVYAKDTFLSKNQVKTEISVVDNISCETLKNGDYIETVISSEIMPSDNLFTVSTLSKTKTITKTKTVYYKNAAGSVMWSVSIKATFKYDGNTSKCTSCSHKTTAPGKTWSIKSCISSKSRNKATAKAVATHTDSDGNKYNINRKVTISCSPTGKIS